MKLLITIFLLITTSVVSYGQYAAIQIDKSTYKFPPTQQGVLLEHEFLIINTSNIPLIISDFNVNCTCTKVILPEKPILPGETYPLKVTFDTADKYYFQDRTIGLVTNTSKKYALRIKVKVIPKK